MRYFSFDTIISIGDREDVEVCVEGYVDIEEDVIQIESIYDYKKEEEIDEDDLSQFWIDIIRDKAFEETSDEVFGANYADMQYKERNDD